MPEICCTVARTAGVRHLQHCDTTVAGLKKLFGLLTTHWTGGLLPIAEFGKAHFCQEESLTSTNTELFPELYIGNLQAKH